MIASDSASNRASTYVASAFHAGFAKGRSSGELQIGDGGVRFDGGGRRVALPLQGLRVKLGGASDRLVFFEHPGEPAWSLYTADLAVLENPVLRSQPELRTALNAARRRRQRNRALLLAMVLLVVAAPLALVSNMNWLTALAARQVPPEWEQKLGRSAFAQYRLQKELIDDAKTRQALAALTQPLTAALDTAERDSATPQFEFHIVRDADLNAFALPGGVVVINSGLIERADSANELLGVIAHEISHVTERHGVRNIISSAGLVLTVQMLIGDAGGVFGTIAGAAPLLLTQSYSRDFERDADQRGVALLEAAAVDPRGMETFFRKIVEREKKLEQQIGDENAAAALKALSRFVSTHPATEERIERIRKLSRDSSGPYRDLEPEFAQLKTLLAAHTRDDDSSSTTSKDSGNANPN